MNGEKEKKHQATRISVFSEFESGRHWIVSQKTKVDMHSFTSENRVKAMGVQHKDYFEGLSCNLSCAKRTEPVKVKCLLSIT